MSHEDNVEMLITTGLRPVNDEIAAELTAINCSNCLAYDLNKILEIDMKYAYIRCYQDPLLLRKAKDRSLELYEAAVSGRNPDWLKKIEWIYNIKINNL